ADERVIAQQPVEYALAKGAVATLAEPGVGQEVAVTDHHHALLLVAGPGREPAQCQTEIERPSGFALAGVVADGAGLHIVDRSALGPALLARAQNRRHVPTAKTRLRPRRDVGEQRVAGETPGDGLRRI